MTGMSGRMPQTLKGQSEIKPLTGLRGIAALGVMAFHYWYRDWVPITTVSGHAAARGYISVDLFFILSGFVMSKAYGARFISASSLSSYARFLGLRLARIYPIYAVLLVVATAVSSVHPAYFPPLTVQNVVANFALVQTWIGKDSTIVKRHREPIQGRR